MNINIHENYLRIIQMQFGLNTMLLLTLNQYLQKYWLEYFHLLIVSGQQFAN